MKREDACVALESCARICRAGQLGGNRDSRRLRAGTKAGKTLGARAACRGLGGTAKVVGDGDRYRCGVPPSTGTGVGVANDRNWPGRATTTVGDDTSRVPNRGKAVGCRAGPSPIELPELAESRPSSFGDRGRLLTASAAAVAAASVASAALWGRAPVALPVGPSLIELPGLAASRPSSVGDAGRRLTASTAEFAVEAVWLTA